jgi:hypothetical protein
MSKILNTSENTTKKMMKAFDKLFGDYLFLCLFGDRINVGNSLLLQ